MNNYVSISGIAVYHPEKVLTNEYFIEHFKKKGKEVKHLLEDVYGRERRYVIDKNSEKREDTLTMQIEAAKMVLEKCSLEGKDMDMIVCASQVPEYVVPASSMYVHREIKGKKDSFCYDINANCTGMLLALENMYRYMESNQAIKKVLIVGGEYTSQVQNPENEMGYGVFGDAACAIILERTERNVGLLDSEFFVDDRFCDAMVFPACGMSRIYDVGKSGLYSTLGSVDCGMGEVALRIRNMLERNNLKIEDISAFCFSQFVKRNVEFLRKELEIPEEISPYVGDEYGYTGVTSPFIAFNQALEQGKIKRGDYVLFWTIGSGVQHIIMLMKY